MHDGQVVALEEIVHVHLPVAGHLEHVAPLEAHRREVDRCDALRDARVHLLEIRHALVERDEHQALPFANHEAWEPDVADLEPDGILHLGRSDQPTLLVIEPAVVLAAQAVHALAAAVRERARAMPADVGKCAQGAVPTAQQQYRCAGRLRDDVIAGLLELGPVRDELPGTRENVPAFRGQDLPVRVVVSSQRVGVRKSVAGVPNIGMHRRRPFR